MSEVHDAATSKRYLAALRELQAENGRLQAHIRLSAELATSYSRSSWQHIRDYHLAALNPTEKVSTNG